MDLSIWHFLLLIPIFILVGFFLMYLLFSPKRNKNPAPLPDRQPESSQDVKDDEPVPAWKKQVCHMHIPNNSSTRNESDLTTSETEKDAWEDYNCGYVDSSKCAGRYKINYKDRNGLATERVIRPIFTYFDGETNVIKAFCEFRHANRTFLQSNISYAVDIDTGEVVKNIAEHAVSQYKETPMGVKESLRNLVNEVIIQENNAMNILLHVSRADGRMTKKERIVIAEYLQKYCPNLPSDIEEIVDEVIKDTYFDFDINEFKRLIRSLSESTAKDKLSDIYVYANRIVATEKTIDPMEKAVLEMIQKGFKLQ